MPIPKKQRLKKSAPKKKRPWTAGRIFKEVIYTLVFLLSLAGVIAVLWAAFHTHLR
ncbi:hypothetical protein [Mucilaginibacter sp. MD40]|uniref:hypothetical protein n=1 Tax=Mucilaginibacter sp. MD40 TaxID=2029590 RepID=UPI0013047455|nr:hypothetical protein [Mucilaginibacter sp. MD40]